MPVLRLPPLRNVHVGQHFDAGNHHWMRLFRDGQHVMQQAVNAIARAQFFIGLRLKMNIGGIAVDGAFDNRRDELDDGALIGFDERNDRGAERLAVGRRLFQRLFAGKNPLHRLFREQLREFFRQRFFGRQHGHHVAAGHQADIVARGNVERVNHGDKQARRLTVLAAFLFERQRVMFAEIAFRQQRGGIKLDVGGGEVNDGNFQRIAERVCQPCGGNQPFFNQNFPQRFRGVDLLLLRFFQLLFAQLLGVDQNFADKFV